ncbi:MAG: hypothetical protein JST48_07925 [Bacteroidetes bacterium]|nr:hypothetical protein [Bacteroidota bacterium]
MAKNIGHTSRYEDGRHHINVKLSLIEFEEDGLHFVYSPALDLTGYGVNEKDARDSYDVAMEEFLKYTTNKETINKELQRLGWRVTNTKIQAPTLPELIQSREYLEKIFTEKAYRKTDENVAIPA